ncbi:hypothetical protein [Pelagibacterium luteolum]|uniref:Uncharacterized protein n=1 Tax=Pelagibacterium luteolum TaxID=440168 RepID=A0A1G7SPN9_9HYPH|nr:hypothetical protein [Pelagibacterium luteolum]SDG24852.1 hypothetical protein SAMN04487974_101637 [Pelagibacterium luteolum]
MMAISEREGHFTLGPGIIGLVGCGALLSSLLWVATGGASSVRSQHMDGATAIDQFVAIAPAEIVTIAGYAARFSVSGAEEFDYLWQVSTDDGATFRDVAVGAELVVPAVEPWMDQSLFRVVARGATVHATSNTAILRVTAAQ